MQNEKYNWNIEPSLSVLLEKAVERHGNRTLLTIEDDETVTFTEFDHRVNQMVDLLKNLDITKGDLVGVMLPNIMLFPVTLYACSKLGAVMIPINATYRLEDARYILNFTGLHTLVSKPA